MVTPTPTVRTLWPPAPTQLYVLGSITGGLSVGLLLGLLGTFAADASPALRVTVIVVVACYGVLSDSSRLRLPTPGPRSQVPADVMRYGNLGVLVFGFTLGTGLLTYITTAAPWVIAVAVVAVDPGVATAVGAAMSFGLARGAVHLLKWYSNSQDWQDGLMALMEVPTVYRAISNTAIALTACSAIPALLNSG